jgi:DNA ligase (NAD+)
LVSDAADIFTLRAGDIAALERFGEKSAENIVREVAEKKRIALHRFLYALGILHVGEETALALAGQMTNDKRQKTKEKIKEVLNFFQNLSLEDLQEIPDIGPKVAQSIYDWFREPRNVKLLERLEKAGIEIEALPSRSHSLPPSHSPVFGKSFVLTGGLGSMARSDAKERIRAAGGDASESVTRKTDYLVAGSDPGSKYEKAKKLGVKIIGEKEFLEMLE